MFKIKNQIKRSGGQIFRKFLSGAPFLKDVRLILMYHRVFERIPKIIYDPALFIGKDTFEMHIEEVRQFFEIVPLETLVQTNKGSGRLCTITFDDGWVDNYEIAFPILKKLKVPATIFVPSSLIGSSQGFWFETLYYLANMMKENGDEQVFVNYFHNIVPSWKPATLSEISLSQLISALKQFPADTLDKIMAKACDKLQIAPSDQKSLINWKQAKEMGQHGITFGPHGLQHYILPTLQRKMKREQIYQSLDLLQDYGLPTVSIFSYPNGDWDKECIDLLDEAGYMGALTANLGYNTSQTNPFLLNRVGLHEKISSNPNLFWFRILQAITRGKAFE